MSGLFNSFGNGALAARAQTCDSTGHNGPCWGEELVEKGKVLKGGGLGWVRKREEEKKGLKNQRFKN